MKIDRAKVHTKYNGRCAYCGKEITVKEMQVDHLVPKKAGGTDDISNLMPSCRRCNHYKRAHSLETFREYLSKMKEKLLGSYLGKIAQDYGMVTWNGWDEKFFFEKQD